MSERDDLVEQAYYVPAPTPQATRPTDIPKEISK